MSVWSYVQGTIEVSVPGRTQPEIDYILQTVLDHLPRVTGSERDMMVYAVRHQYAGRSCPRDEFGQHTNNLVDIYGNKSSSRGWMNTQDRYSLVLVGHFRDRMFEETHREFMKWLCRLSKRLQVVSVLVRIDGDFNMSLVIDAPSWDNPYCSMFEYPSYGKDDREPAWYEHLMWKKWKDTSLPIEHVVKYYDVKEADEEFFAPKGKYNP